MVRDTYLVEATDSSSNRHGLIQSFYMLNKLITGKTVLGEMFGDYYGGQEDSVLSIDISLCDPEKLKILFRLICSLVVQIKDVYGEKVEFLDDFLKTSGIKQCSVLNQLPQSDLAEEAPSILIIDHVA